MTLNEMIFLRSSCRSFTGKPVDGSVIEKILSFEPKPLDPGIKVRMDIVRRDQVKCICPWTTPQLIAVYTQEAEGCLENVGFLFQQLDLYLQTLGLGVCWLGMGRMDPKTAPAVEGMRFAIMLAFGHPKTDFLRRDGRGFKRKPLEKIADTPDQRLEPARLAPSAVNHQPWYFTHAGEAIRVWRSQKGVAGDMHRIDMGIALAHLYVAHPDAFRFFREEPMPALPGHAYVGSVTL